MSRISLFRHPPAAAEGEENSSKGLCRIDSLQQRRLHTKKALEPLTPSLKPWWETESKKKKKHLLHVESRELSGPFSVLWPQMVWSWPVRMTPMISFAGSDSVNAATSISTVGNVWWCDSVLSIPANNGDVKDCKIRKSLLASQYYLFWLSFYTETAKLKKKCHGSRSIDLKWLNEDSVLIGMTNILFVLEQCGRSNWNDNKIESLRGDKGCVFHCLSINRSQTFVTTWGFCYYKDNNPFETKAVVLAVNIFLLKNWQWNEGRKGNKDAFFPLHH